MVQQLSSEKKIDIFTTLATCSLLAVAILCLVGKKKKEDGLKLYHYCFKWKPLIHNVVVYILEKYIHLGFGFTLLHGKIS